MSNKQLPAEVQLPKEILQDIELKAEHEAALQFHPVYSPDQNTACRICYRNGAKEYAIWKQRYDELKAQSGADVFVPCHEDHPDCCGCYQSLDGQSLAYVRESKVPIVQSGAVWVKADKESEETLPNKSHGMVFIKFDNGTQRTGGTWDVVYRILMDGWKDVYWLDENGATDLQAKYDELKKEVGHYKGMAIIKNELYQELKERFVKVEAALKDLIELKNMKDAEGKTDAYLHQQPIAWNNAREALAWKGEGEKEVVKVGLKFRSKAAPINSYEVVEVYANTKEFKVKETRECQVSGTTCYEVWSIDGFEKYFKLGVYYIKKEVDNG